MCSALHICRRQRRLARTRMLPADSEAWSDVGQLAERRRGHCEAEDA
jgi:hypothetical protein